MRYFVIGIILSIIGVLLSFILWGRDNAYLITGGIGLLFIGLAMIFSGSLVSGDRMRGNLSTESREDKHKRNSITFRLSLIGIPNLAIAVLIYFLVS